MSLIDKQLRELQRFCLSKVTPGLLGPGNTWLHFDALQRRHQLIAEAFYKRQSYEPPPKKQDRLLLCQAQLFLCPFAPEASCRRARPRWTNVEYCPPTPFGNYIWPYTCQMLQEIIWLRKTFRAGFAFGLRPVEPFRQANPHRPVSRSRLSWDCGYILGLAWEKAVLAWLGKQLIPTEQP